MESGIILLSAYWSVGTDMKPSYWLISASQKSFNFVWQQALVAQKYSSQVSCSQKIFLHFAKQSSLIQRCSASKITWLLETLNVCIWFCNNQTKIIQIQTRQRRGCERVKCEVLCILCCKKPLKDFWTFKEQSEDFCPIMLKYFDIEKYILQKNLCIE